MRVFSENAVFGSVSGAGASRRGPAVAEDEAALARLQRDAEREEEDLWRAMAKKFGLDKSTNSDHIDEFAGGRGAVNGGGEEGGSGARRPRQERRRRYEEGGYRAPGGGEGHERGEGHEEYERGDP
jgi:hypothetical protein